jgi:hypothetical protein
MLASAHIKRVLIELTAERLLHIRMRVVADNGSHGDTF